MYLVELVGDREVLAVAKVILIELQAVEVVVVVGISIVQLVAEVEVTLTVPPVEEVDGGSPEEAAAQVMQHYFVLGEEYYYQIMSIEEVDAGVAVAEEEGAEN